MGILEQLNNIFIELDIPVETGIFSGKAPDEYAVITPLSDIYALYADNVPQFDTEEARISLFTKGNYLQLKKSIEKAIIKRGLTITDRRYIGHEDDTDYHHYSIDTQRTDEIMEELSDGNYRNG